jgi:ionotropic glutamate receptor
MFPPNLSLMIFQKYDIAIGDITISSNRSSYVDFTPPYTESAVAMVVPLKNSSNKDTWILLQPLSRDLWIKSSLLVIYIGVVVWLLEFLGNKTKASGSTTGKLGITTFFSLFGDS